MPSSATYAPGTPVVLSWPLSPESPPVRAVVVRGPVFGRRYGRGPGAYYIVRCDGAEHEEAVSAETLHREGAPA